MSEHGETADRKWQEMGNGTDDFVMEMIGSQNRLHAYILSVMFDKERARDVLQQTNLVLLEKKDEYVPGTAFGAWACKIAFYEVLAERRRSQRDRHMFSDDLLALIATRSERITASLDQRSEALEECLALLPSNQREILMARYRPGNTIGDIANSVGKSPGAVSVLLHRIRSALLDCVSNKLKNLPQA
ncbi:MAG: sigma-70 family RNA polymerase sigma factor [Lacipirellulaceae bacterium]